jgi:hypothetical protein
MECNRQVARIPQPPFGITTTNRQGASMVAPAFSRRIACGIIFLLMAVTTVSAGEVRLSWEASSGATSYSVYRGSAPGQYGPPTDVGNTTQATVEGLGDCAASYLAVTASNSAGESGYSSEVASWPRSVIVSADPATLQQGSQTAVVVQGVNFRTGDTPAVSHTGVQIDAMSVDSCNQLTLTLSVAADAPGGSFGLTLTHPSGVAGTADDLFSIADGPPSITGVEATSVGRTSALIVWDTNEPADSRVFYREQGDESYVTVEVPDQVTTHAVELTGLEPETTYEFHVSSTDASGNTTTTTPDETFTTTSSPYDYLRMETEAGILVEPVTTGSGDDAFGGAWIGTPSGLSDGSAGNPLGTASYGVHIPESGDWTLWIRMFAENGSRNSWYESIDGATRQSFSTTEYGEWTWVAGRTYTLDAGQHTVELGGREAGTLADRLLLTDDPDFVPTERPDADVTPPGSASEFLAVSEAGAIRLSWTNPSDADLSRIVIRYRQDGVYPTSPADGLALVDRLADPADTEEYLHEDVQVGISYFYSAFSVDASGNVSVAAHAMGAVGSPPLPPTSVTVY